MAFDAIDRWKVASATAVVGVLVVAVVLATQSPGVCACSFGTASFDFEHNATAETLTVTFASGDVLRPNRTMLSVGGDRVPWERSEVADEGSSHRISAGDTARVNLTGVDTVKVLWVSESGRHTQVLDQWGR